MDCPVNSINYIGTYDNIYELILLLSHSHSSSLSLPLFSHPATAGGKLAFDALSSGVTVNLTVFSFFLFSAAVGRPRRWSTRCSFLLFPSRPHWRI